MTLQRDVNFEFAATEEAASGSSRSRLPHVPALDGLRGLAVAAVVLYHLNDDWPAPADPAFGWARGGFLGVSLFFTLSGFLITSVLLGEHDEHDRIDYRQFWVRRFRRLLPAAWAGVVLAVVFALLAGKPDQLRSLPGDVVGALGNVANWRFIVDSNSYTATYKPPSPLLHYWSLAIEEQFYLVFPLLVAALVRRQAGVRAWGAVIGGLMAASFALTLVLYDPADTSRVYFNTGTRIAEILAGVALALVLRGWWTQHPRRRTGRYLARGDRLPTYLRNWAPIAGLVAVVALWSRAGTEDPWLYRGGFFVVAALSCLLVAGVISDGPLSRLLRARPLIGLGAISYGVYVYHWPIFSWLTTDRTHLPTPLLTVARLGATLALSVASYRFFEKPIRHGQLRLRLTMAWGPVLLVAVLIGGSFALSSRADQREINTAEGAGGASVITRPPVTAPVSGSPAGQAGATTTTSPPKAPPPGKVLLLGDSLLHQAYPVIESEFRGQGTETLAIGGPQQTLLRRQAVWLRDLEGALTSFQPDVVVLESCCGHYDPKDLYVDENGKALAVDSDALWAAFERRADEAVTLAQKHAKAVLWTLVPPAKDIGFYGPIDKRITRTNQIAVNLVKKHPGLGLVDWSVIAGPTGKFEESLPDASGNLVTVRAADGFHFAPAGMSILAGITRDSVDELWQKVATKPDKVVAPS